MIWFQIYQVLQPQELYGECLYLVASKNEQQAKLQHIEMPLQWRNVSPLSVQEVVSNTGKRYNHTTILQLVYIPMHL